MNANDLIVDTVFILPAFTTSVADCYIYDERYIYDVNTDNSTQSTVMQQPTYNSVTGNWEAVPIDKSIT